MGGRPVNADELFKLSELIANTARDITAREVAPLLEANEKLSKLVAGLTAKVIELDKRRPEKGERGEKGDAGADGKDGAPGRHGEDGAAGRDGIDGEPGPAGPMGPPGTDGKDGEPGRDGIDGKDGAPGISGRDGAAGADGKDGAPGRDGRDGLPGRDGDAGKDGAPGTDGKDGRDGKDGADGLGFDDLEVIQSDDMRTVILRYRRGDQVKEFPIRLRTVSYCGVWKEGEYYTHDAVTLSGNLWIARCDTTAKPADNNSDWQMAVRKGRDGKDGEPGKQGPTGPAGKDGRDLTKY